MRMSRFLAAIVMVAGLVVVVQGQQPNQPFKKRGFAGGGGGYGGPENLLKNKAVAEDIKLSADQLTKLKEWSKDGQEKLDADRKAKFAALKDVPLEQRGEKTQKVMAEFNAEVYKQVGAFLSADQVTRLKQIDRQSHGVRVFNDAEVVDALKLTDDQKAKIKEIQEAVRASFGGGGRPDPAKMQQARKEGLEKAVAVLTDDQRRTWAQLIGPPFDTSKLNTGFPMRRPGGGTQPGQPQPKTD